MTEEQYFSATDDDDIETFIISEKIISKKNTDNRYLIEISFRDLLAYSKPWCFNRKINEDKVNELYKELCNSYTIPYILHAVYDDKHIDPVKKLLILDGQHRLEATRLYIENNDISWNCQYCVWICVYKISNSESDNTAKVIDIFKKINNNRVFDESELPDTFIIDLVKEICEIPLFKRQKVIKTNSLSNTCHQPFIHVKELNNLFNHYKNIIKTKTIVELVENIQKINHLISLKSFDDLYHDNNKNSEKIKYQKAMSKSFFLNLKKSKYAPEIWIKFIHNPELLK